MPLPSWASDLNWLIAVKLLLNDFVETFDGPLARTVADLTQAGKILSVAGGGDTVAALAAAGVEDKFSYVSTAGGAFLEWMEGKTLPGVAALIWYPP